MTSELEESTPGNGIGGSLDFFARIEACLYAPGVDEKIELTRGALRAWGDGELCLDRAARPALPIAAPGRPQRPRLVPPRQLAQRKLISADGRAALIHAVAHIEFNAINLALDACYRFRDMPRAYYGDWLRVASEEATHFSLLQERLRALGYAYGDFDAHDGLWEMAVETATSPLLRMALVPRVLEARGLDVTPAMIARLRAAGDEDTAAVLEVILREEVGHVGIGTRWFRHCCERASVPAEQTFFRLLREHYRGVVRGPFNEAARLSAGFSVGELAKLRELESNS